MGWVEIYCKVLPARLKYLNHFLWNLPQNIFRSLSKKRNGPVYCLRVLRKKLCNCHFSFFIFFLSFPVSFSGNILRLVIKEACHQDPAHSVDTTRNISVKFVLQVFLRDTCSTWHGVFKITTIHNIQESKRNTPETWKQVR